jgi:hypothetical protein
MTVSIFKNSGRLRLAFVSFLFAGQTCLSQGHSSPRLPLVFATTRGGAISSVEEDLNSSYHYLAEFVADKFPEATMQKLTKTLERMAAAQQTFKGLDGAAHEAYQRTRSGEDIDTSVSGRAQRSASRLAATAEGLLACELVEMVEDPCVVSEEGLARREVVLNLTLSESNVKLGKSNVAVLILYEPSYDGGAGLDHGTILSLAESSPRGGDPKGRLLVVLGDTVSDDLVELLTILNQKPKRIKLSSGLVTDEVASVQPTLYKAAGDLLKEVEPHLRKYNTTAIHFVGRSLAGGVASLAATMIDGTLPLPKSKQEKKKKSKLKEPMELVEDLRKEVNATAEPEILPLSGLGRARSSALTLGAPPCLSSNVLAAFCTSFLYGDDVVVRVTSDSIDRLCDRIQRNLKGGFVGRKIGWMSDTISLTVSSLQSHAHGSEGEEANLSVPGRAYLVRPRRLGGLCSIHEVGNLNKGGREAFRANLFWQLQDVLLSKSMWRHHKLESYIRGLDRVQLRGKTGETEEEAMY